MLKAIEVHNYRSFALPAKLEIRPITILMGRNSAGKSSLTRLFPLIRQSLTRDTSSPILWTSTTVDFGRIGDVINRSSESNELKITFEIDTTSIVTVAERRRRHLSATAKSLSGKRLWFSASLTPTLNGKTDYRSFTIKIDDDTLTVTLQDGDFSRIYINNKRLDIRKYTQSLEAFTTRLFPSVFFRNGNDGRFESGPATGDRMNELLSIFVEGADTVDESVDNSHRGLFAHPVSTTARIDRFYSADELTRYLAEQPGFKPDSIVATPRIKELSELSFFTFFPVILQLIETSLSPIFSSSSYLGPIRSSGSRFYREQELSVERIDDKGDNFSTYISSLRPHELSTFNAMLLKAFGVKVRAHQTIGHMSIELAVDGSESYDNLADVGFGFSQLLPLVAQIHSHSRGGYVPYEDQVSQQIIAIEQPELHLHPAFQAQLADLFVSAFQSTPSSSRQPNFVLESHSETMLARLGELVAEGAISSNDIIVHFVEKDDQGGASSVRVGEFDADGIISNWPLGFLSARSV